MSAPTAQKSSGRFEELLEQARGGSSVAMGQLFEESRNYLTSIALEELNRGLPPVESPSDMVQDAILEAFEDFKQFHGDSQPQFRAWLKVILHNTIQDFLLACKAQKRDVRRVFPLLRNRSSRQETAGMPVVSSTADLVMEAEEHERYRLAFQALPEYLMEVLQLRSRNIRSFKAIGVILNISESAARSLHGRAVKALSELVHARAILQYEPRE